MAALQPKDGGGNWLSLVRFAPVGPIIVLVRFTDVISLARPAHHVDELVWLVVFNDVTLHPHGMTAGPSLRGYALVAVDARTGVAFTEDESGPQLPKGHL